MKKSKYTANQGGSRKIFKTFKDFDPSPSHLSLAELNKKVGVGHFTLFPKFQLAIAGLFMHGIS